MPNYYYPGALTPTQAQSPVGYGNQYTTPMSQTYYPQSFGQPWPNDPYQQRFASAPPKSQSIGIFTLSLNINWVQGRAGAEAFQLGPGERAVLFDSNEQIFYIKDVGMDGRPNPLMAFRYEAFDFGNVQNGSSSAQVPDMSDYVTKEDFNRLEKMYEESRATLNDISRRMKEGSSNGKSSVR